MVSSSVVSVLGLVQPTLLQGASHITAKFGFQAEYTEEPLEGFKQGCDTISHVVEKFWSVENCLWIVKKVQEAEVGEQVASDASNSDSDLCLIVTVELEGSG